VIRFAQLVCLMMVAAPALGSPEISGTVKDAATDKAIKGVIVDVEVGFTARANVVQTKADGHFTFDVGKWPKSDRQFGRTTLTFHCPNYQDLRQRVEFSGSLPTDGVFTLTRVAGGGLSSTLRDSLRNQRDETAQTLAFAAFDLDTAGVHIDAGRLEQRLERRLMDRIASYLVDRGLDADHCRISVRHLPSEIDGLNLGAVHEAGEVLDALAVISGELRVRRGPSGPTLSVATTFLPIPTADSLALPIQNVVDRLSLDPDEPSSIVGEAGQVWAEQTALTVGLREAREGIRTSDRARVARARELIADVQGTLTSADFTLQRWIARAIGILDRILRS